MTQRKPVAKRQAATWTDQIEEQPNRGRLACAIGADETEHLAAVDGEVDADDPAPEPVELGQVLSVNRRRRDSVILGCNRSRRRVPHVTQRRQRPQHDDVGGEQ